MRPGGMGRRSMTFTLSPSLLGGVSPNHQETCSQIGALGAGWPFEGVGDYSGTRTDSFPIENTSTGGLVTGTVVSGQAHYTQVGLLAAPGRFHGNAAEVRISFS
jgi:hypothetical protein